MSERWSVAGMLGQPESPRWLVQKNRTSEAEQSARKLWGSDGASQLGDSKSGGALPAYAQSIPVMPAEFSELYHIPLTYAMTAVARSLQQVYAHDAMICIPAAIVHNTIKLPHPCLQHTAASHLAFPMFYNCLLEQVVRRLWLSRAQPSCWV